ncbi:hypothetical protein SADUNF_Sadunf10G0005000 [Salix dunnii]|uniref:Apple domain-containing protein n=1 Tax=Salix dunnii TaxID=1413687 RepID=A0A835MNN1_9ROSI|nr:hypothetical protein SADUNF_Sadunf10G0005000 [Salix dunnii]
MPHDSKANFAWQRFDHPTDTLLVAQSLRIEGATRLVSRASEKQSSDGPCSLVLEPRRLAMDYRSHSSPRPYLYYTPDKLSESKGRSQNVTLYTQGGEIDGFYYDVALSTPFQDAMLATANYNTTLSFLRLGIDGNLRVHTFYDKGSTNDEIRDGRASVNCGHFDQCVAGPLPNGLLGWSKDCQPFKSPSCGSKKFHYYRMEGVDHYVSQHPSGTGPVEQDDCRRKCSGDCKCLGYFYGKDIPKCWIAYDLHTLTRVGNSTHSPMELHRESRVTRASEFSDTIVAACKSWVLEFTDEGPTERLRCPIQDHDVKDERVLTTAWATSCARFITTYTKQFSNSEKLYINPLIQFKGKM